MESDNIEDCSKDQLDRLLCKRNAILKSLRGKKLKQRTFTISFILMVLSAMYGSCVFMIARFGTEHHNWILLLIAIPSWIYVWLSVECGTMFEEKINAEINILKDDIKAIDCSIKINNPFYASIATFLSLRQ
ncbi:MAG TPA: hypothetical protein VFD03_09710 [Clostridia bacterium]|nr:hypothetical protein [Clostridia bacterium]